MTTAPIETIMSFLAVRAAERICAVPLVHVVEIMRPMPIERLAGAPAFVPGLAIIRGTATPVVDLAALLTETPATANGASTRFVTLRTGSRVIALQVEAVLALRTLHPAHLAALPPLWQGENSPAITALGMLDRELLLVLETTRLLPGDVVVAQPPESSG